MNPDTNRTGKDEPEDSDEESRDITQFLSMVRAVAISAPMTVIAVALIAGMAMAMPPAVGNAGAVTLASTECEVTADDPKNERYASTAAEKLQTWMEDDGFEGPNVSVHRGRLEVSYVSTAQSSDEVVAEENVTDLAVQYMCLVDAGYSMGGIYAQPHTVNGELIGAYQIEKAWAEEYNHDGLTQDELAEYIADSFNSAEAEATITTTTTPESNANADVELSTESSDPDAVMRAIGEELESSAHGA